MFNIYKGNLIVTNYTIKDTSWIAYVAGQEMKCTSMIQAMRMIDLFKGGSVCSNK